MSKFSDTLRRLGFETYNAYLSSPHWAEFRSSYRTSGRSMKCAVCQVGPIQLHHHTYERLGAERLEDVTPFCRVHHVAVHEWLKSSGRIYVQYTKDAIAALSGKSVAPLPPRKTRKQKKSNPKWACTRCGQHARRGLNYCTPCGKSIGAISEAAPKPKPVFTDAKYHGPRPAVVARAVARRRICESVFASLAAMDLEESAMKKAELYRRTNNAVAIRLLAKKIGHQRIKETEKKSWSDPLEAIRMLANGHQLPALRKITKPRIGTP